MLILTEFVPREKVDFFPIVLSLILNLKSSGEKLRL